MQEVLIKVAPTVYDILETTIRAAIAFTEADAGHIFLIKRLEDRLLASHQCLRTDTGAIIRQYEEDSPFIYGPCQHSLDEGKMYYVHDAKTNSLHQLQAFDNVEASSSADPSGLLRLEQVTRERAGDLNTLLHQSACSLQVWLRPQARWRTPAPPHHDSGSRTFSQSRGP
jgi:hypothetical protein